MKLSHKLGAAALVALMLTACGGDQGEEASIALGEAIASEERPTDDLARDASRLPMETLAFAGLEPGMTVLELEAGGGYFTEIISRTVGPDGKVVMQNPQAFDAFLGDALETRLGNDRLANVEVMRSDFDTIDMPDDSVDMVTWIQGPHELWFTMEDGTGFGDPQGAFNEIARVLKPDGVFLAVDHHAAEGAGTEVGGTLHRIPMQVVTSYAANAGMKLTETSDILERADDPLDVSVFDPAVRGNTSQFVALYRK